MAKFDFEYFYFEESSKELEEEEPQEMLVVQEVQETNDLTALLVYTSMTKSYLPSSQCYTLCRLEPEVKFSSEADHLKSCHFGFMSNNCLHQVKLEDHCNKDPFVVVYVTLYGRQPLFDERSLVLSRRR